MIKLRRYTQFWFLRKGSGNSFSTTFCVLFFNKNVSHVIFYQLTEFYCLMSFTSWDIGQYVCWNCLRTRLRRHKFWKLNLSLSHFLNMTKKSRQKFKYFEKETKKIAKNCLRPGECAFKQIWRSTLLHDVTMLHNCTLPYAFV